MSPTLSTPRPVSLVVTSALTAVASGFMAVMGALSMTSNPGPLSFGIGAVLLLWSLIVGWAAWGLWGLRRWARGPVVAAGLLHLASFAGFVGTQPLALIPAVLALVTVLAALRPATTAALGLDRDE